MNTIHKPDNLKKTDLSDGSELIPAEVKARSRREGGEPPTEPARAATASSSIDTRKGFAVDRNGLVNNYPITPDPYLQKEPRFGFTRFAEIWNGRLAMIGFAASVLTELITGKSLFAYWFGLG